MIISYLYITDLICETNISLAFYSEEGLECARLGGESLGGHRGRRKMLLSLKNFSGHTGCLEMMVCRGRVLKTSRSFPVETHLRLLPGTTASSQPGPFQGPSSQLLHIPGREAKGSFPLWGRREGPGGAACG